MVSLRIPKAPCPHSMKRTRRTPLTNDFQQSLISIREALCVLGGKWTIPILVSVADGEKRFVEIKYHVHGITARVLSRELKDLQLNNLVRRNVDRASGIVTYSVTQKCTSLEKVIEGLKEWGDYHRTNIFNRPIKTVSIPTSRAKEKVIQGSPAPAAEGFRNA